MRLILFDIDGTLLSCGPQVRPIFASALTDVFGTAGALENFDFAGKTDPSIVLELMASAGLSRHEVLPRLGEVRAIYERRLAERLDPSKMTLLPFVVELLDRLTTRGEQGDVGLGLLTGNWAPCARTKLAAFDLNRFFTFGAFGCDGIERAELPPVALDRARAEFGRGFRSDEVWIVGDSRHDVACARAHGIPSLAVATGRASTADLLAAGADRVMEDLRDAEAALCA